jgi:hypothetical protein
MNKPLSREAIRAIAIRRNVERKAAAAAAQPTLPGIVAEEPKTMHPRLLAMCVDAGGFDQNARHAA